MIRSIIAGAILGATFFFGALSITWPASPDVKQFFSLYTICFIGHVLASIIENRK